jgi:hypothetical protein
MTGWTDHGYWRLVKELQAGELRRDALPGLVRNRYRGPLSQAPDLRGTYDWHDPRIMPHPGPHQTPHIQVKLPDGDSSTN